MDHFTTVIYATLGLIVALGLALTVVGCVTLVRAIQNKTKGKLAGVFSMLVGIIAISVPVLFVLYMGYII